MPKLSWAALFVSLLSGCDAYQLIVFNDTDEPVRLSIDGSDRCRVTGTLEQKTKLMLECAPSELRVMAASGPNLGHCTAGARELQRKMRPYRDDDEAWLATGQSTQRELVIDKHFCTRTVD